MKRKMKSRFTKFMAAVIMIVSVYGSALMYQPQTVSAETAITTIPVTAVSNIANENVNSQTAGDTIALGQGVGYSKLYQFTLTKPAYVVVNVSSDYGYKDYSNLTTIYYKITYNSGTSSFVQGTSEKKQVFNGSREKDYLVLAAGTYYVGVNTATFSDYLEKGAGTYSIAVNAQYLDAVTTNTSKARATSISTDKKITGLSSAATRTGWYKFNIGSTTAVSINSYITNEWSSDKGTVVSGICAVALRNSAGRVMKTWNLPQGYDNPYSTGSISLSAGTYYLSYYYDNYWNYSGSDAGSGSDVNKGITNTLKTGNASTSAYTRNGGELHFKITTIKPIKKLTLKNTSGKKIKTTYTAVSGAKGYEIQYSTSKSFSSKKTVTTKKTTYTLSKLTKGKVCYVRVRAWKYDEDYNKVYSSWVTKSVKITK